MKRIVFLFILVLSVSVNLPNAFSFNDNTTHPNLSKKAFDKSQTTLNSYYENYLMFKNGIHKSINGKTIYEWIQQGAEEEDRPMCRASNHFHNPYLDWTESGLTDTLPLINAWCDDFGWGEYPPEEIRSNVMWATGYSGKDTVDLTTDVAEKNIWDWESARKYFYANLTGLDIKTALSSHQTNR
jgi:hypothetical protein